MITPLALSIVLGNPGSASSKATGQAPSHLAPWKRVTLTFSFVADKPSRELTIVEAFAAKAPVTGEQMNTTSEITIRPKNGVSIPTSLLESKDVEFETNEGKNQKGLWQMVRTSGASYPGGFEISVRYSADIYEYVSLPKSTLTTLQGSYPPNALADFNKSTVSDWGNRFIGPVGAPDPAFSLAGGVIKAIRDKGIKYAGEGTVHSASELLARGSGECASISELFVAGMLGSGYSARSLTGWLINQGHTEEHCKAEVAARGFWAPIEPTDALHGGDPLLFVGNGAKSGSTQFFTLHFGQNALALFQDAKGEYHRFKQVSFQTPMVRYYCKDGTRSDVCFMAQGSGHPTISYEPVSN